MKNTMKSIAAIALALAMTLLCMTGCAVSGANQPVTALVDGGTILLRVNPEIAIDYDNDGMVTGITAKNDDALKIIANYAGFSGKHAKTVISELVAAIGDAGYFVEEIDGTRRQITIEIEPGSALPNDRFLDDVVADVKAVVANHNWQTPLNLEGTSDYGMTDYIDTDYGIGSDGYTDYNDTDYGTNNDGITDYDHNINDGTDYGPGNDGITDYDGTDYLGNTDYGINADGNTDYNDSDYGVWGDGITDYDNNIFDYTDYGEGSDGITDYDGTDYANNTDYGVNGDGDTDYNNTDYGTYNDGVTDYTDYGSSTPAATNSPASSGNTDYGTNYGDSAYNAPAPAPQKPASTSSYGGGDSGYSNYGGGGDSGYSGYGES